MVLAMRIMSLLVLICLACMSCARRGPEKIQPQRRDPSFQPVKAFAELLAQRTPAAGWQLVGQDGHLASNRGRRKQSRRHPDTVMYTKEKISAVSDLEKMRQAADLIIADKPLPRPFLPLPGWEETAKRDAIIRWVDQRRKQAEEDFHMVLAAVRDEAEAGSNIEGATDNILGMLEVGLSPPPLEKVKKSEVQEVQKKEEKKEDPKWSSMTEFLTSGTTQWPKSAKADVMYPAMVNVHVAEGARRKGIATDLIEMAEQQVVAAGYERMYITVERGNIAARKLYDRLGYKMVYAKNVADDDTGNIKVVLILRKDFE